MSLLSFSFSSSFGAAHSRHCFDLGVYVLHGERADDDVVRWIGGAEAETSQTALGILQGTVFLELDVSGNTNACTNDNDSNTSSATTREEGWRHRKILLVVDGDGDVSFVVMGDIFVHSSLSEL